MNGNGKGNQKSFNCRKHKERIFGNWAIDQHLRRLHGLMINTEGDFVDINEEGAKFPVLNKFKTDDDNADNAVKTETKLPLLIGNGEMGDNVDYGFDMDMNQLNPKTEFTE